MADTDSHTLDDLARRLAQEARLSFERRLLLIAGDAAWCVASAQTCLNAAGFHDALWLSDAAPADARRMDVAKAQTLLGGELSALVVDARCGFDPDAFGAAAGCVVAGGLILLLTPPLSQWAAFPDPQNARVAVEPHVPASLPGRFLKRLARVCARSDQILRVEQGAPLPPLPAVATLMAVPEHPQDAHCRTDDQAAAVAHILKTARGHRRRPTMLVSDRGRGKSAALGIAAAELMAEGKRSIVVTAPRLAAVQAVFEHARRGLRDAQLASGRLTWRGARLDFMAPDELIAAAPDTDLVLVDEAAGIPLPLLETLLDQHARVVFASTVYGYEGSGRGFQLKFPRLLDEQAPGWRQVNLTAPIRWAHGDPVERFVFDALLLDAPLADVSGLQGIDAEQCRWHVVNRDQLVDDETLLGQVFGLLVLSHYRTRPFDLRHLLDGPNLEVHVLMYGDQVVATALLALEGELDEQLATAVFAGKRRLRGHLLPQSMVAHVGVEGAARQRYGRVMRIAVHPQLQGQGLGTRLLDAVVAHADKVGLDWVGTCFGVTVPLLRFWRGSGFQPVRLGISREASSGSHSGLLLRPLSASAAAVLVTARARYTQHLLHSLGDVFNSLEPALVRTLLVAADEPVAVALSDAEWREVAAFACAQRGFEDSALAIGKLTHVAMGSQAVVGQLEDVLFAVLVKRVLQRQDWATIVAATELAGKAAVISCLRDVVKTLLWVLADKDVRAYCDGLAKAGD